jgi:hypothetical protein
MRAAIILAAAGLSLAGCQDSRLAKAEAAVKEKLNDPYSAIFENVEICPASDLFHGSVNAKNRLGAFTGEAPFIVVSGTAYIAQQEGPQQPSDLLNARFFDALSRECFFGDGARDFIAFAKSYDVSKDSLDKYYKGVRAKAK